MILKKNETQMAEVTHKDKTANFTNLEDITLNGAKPRLGLGTAILDMAIRYQALSSFWSMVESLQPCIAGLVPNLTSQSLPFFEIYSLPILSSYTETAIFTGIIPLKSSLFKVTLKVG